MNRRRPPRPPARAGCSRADRACVSRWQAAGRRGAPGPWISHRLARARALARRLINMGNTLTPFGSSTVSSPRIEFPEFPLKLDIKPHISSDSAVLLEVSQDAEELVNLTQQGPPVTRPVNGG